MDAQLAGLLALVQAYKLRCSGAPSTPDDDVLLRFLLLQIQNPAGKLGLCAALDDAPGVVQVKPSVLIALLRIALDADQLKQQLEQSEASAATAWNAIDEARRIMKDPRQGTTAQRQSAAVKCVVQLNGKHGKGREDPKYQEAANHYYALRCGGHHFIDGVLTQLKKRTHEEAVREVCDRFHLEWDSLRDEWKKQGIQVSFQAPIYDEPDDS